MGITVQGVRNNKANHSFLFLLFICVVLGTTVAFIYFQNPTVYILPIGLLLLAYVYDDLSRLFYLLCIVLPFSMEYYFDAVGLGTDLPSEPLMIVLAGCTLLLLVYNQFELPKSYITHPIWLLLIFQVFWILITTISSTVPVISIKFLLAKLWYLLSFLFFHFYLQSIFGTL